MLNQKRVDNAQNVHALIEHKTTQKIFEYRTDMTQKHNFCDEIRKIMLMHEFHVVNVPSLTFQANVC